MRFHAPILVLFALAACGGGGDALIDAPPAADAPAADVPPLDAPELDAPEIDAPDIDAPELDAPELDAPEIDAPDIDAPDPCGDGVLDPGEPCDTTLFPPDATCATYGHASGELACMAGCQIDTSACFTCGNGRREGPEACDDAGTMNADGCSAACTVEPGWVCFGQPTTCRPLCGDGLILGDEQCDDGNLSNGDGCNNACDVETRCQCTGAPSVCGCWVVEVIGSHQPNGVETASLVLDDAGQVQIAYTWAQDFTGPNGTSMEHVHAIHAERTGGIWVRTEIETWDQGVAGRDESTFQLAEDGGVLQLYYRRLYHPGGTFAVATRTATGWDRAYAAHYYNDDVTHGGGAWHGLVRPVSWSFRYVAGAPGAFTIDEPAPVSFAAAGRLELTTTGNTFVASSERGTGSTSYVLGLRERVAPATWNVVYTHQTTAAAGSRVYSIWHQPLALPGGAMALVEEGFACGGQRWIRAHGTAPTPEDVLDLTALQFSCSASGYGYTSVSKVVTVDPLGRPHLLINALPAFTSPAIQDHYRDATGWRMRTVPLAEVTLFDIEIDATGTTHLAVGLRGIGTSYVSRVAYVRIPPAAWATP